MARLRAVCFAFSLVASVAFAAPAEQHLAVESECQSDCEALPPQSSKPGALTDVVDPEGGQSGSGLGTGTLSLLGAGMRFYETGVSRHSFAVGGSGAGSFSSGRVFFHGMTRYTESIHYGWWLGHGQTGFDGGLAYDFGRGMRWPEEGHGFALRGGGRGLIQGNDDYYLSRLELPHVSAGYQYLGRGVVLELTQRVALLLDGRFRVDDGPMSDADAQAAWATLLNAGVEPFYGSTRLHRSGDLTSLSVEACALFWELLVPCARYELNVQGTTFWATGRRVVSGALALGLSPI